MDEINAQKIKAQGSICSLTNGEETCRVEVSKITDRRICLIGRLGSDTIIRPVAESYGVPVVTSETGQEYVRDDTLSTFFVLDKFEGDVYNSLFKAKQSILGPPALQQLARMKVRELPDNTRPLFNIAMKGVVVSITGFRNKDDLINLIPLIHHMGGSIRKDISSRVTHLIANTIGGEKYQYAATFKVPVMNYKWVYASWERRYDLDFSAVEDNFLAEYKLKPFHGAKVCFMGFPEDEEKHMTEILLQNGGSVTTADDTSCSHVVVDETSIAERGELPPRGSPSMKIVKAEWFWTSVQKEVSQDEREYLFDDFPDHEQVHTPTARRDSQPPGSSRRKRKRLQETIQALATASPSTYKRRTSGGEAGLLSVSGSFLDCTASPEAVGVAGALPEAEAAAAETPRKALSARQQVFLELLQTETNYVSILNTIITMFQKHLEDMPEEEALLNNTELNLIFGKLPAIYDTHVKMLRDLTEINLKWSETASVGNVIIKYSTDLLKAYPPFINYFEEMKEVLTQCDQNKPRFHAFLKACQTRPECGRQSLQELMIRPVQRLGSISLLLNDILKNTPKTNPDHSALDQALAALREVMLQINEDKRKTEGQVTLFNIFNEIDNCPPDIVSSHRSFVAKTEVIQLSSSEGLSTKGNNLMLFLFSDQLEVCKKKSKAFNTLKSPTATTQSTGMKVVERSSSKTLIKPYKHVRLMALNTIKRVIDIKETEDCQKVFSLVCRNTDENKERLYSFAMAEENADKISFLKILTRQMANNACTADADKFMAYLEPHQLDIDTSDLSNGTFSKAFKFATRTKLKVGRAFSFNKTPSKLKRAVSSMMSPFGSSTNLTPASQLAQMRLASYSNINELGTANNDEDESPPVAPMSVQPTRKHKASSLGVNALKRL